MFDEGLFKHISVAVIFIATWPLLAPIFVKFAYSNFLATPAHTDIQPFDTIKSIEEFRELGTFQGKTELEGSTPGG